MVERRAYSLVASSVEKMVDYLAVTKVVRWVEMSAESWAEM